MKKLIIITIVLTMTLTLCAWGGEQESQETVERKTGVLTMLNLSEEDMDSYIYALYLANQQLGKEGYLDSEFNGNVAFDMDPDIIFYDTLDAMLMALNAGDINVMQTYYKTGQYLCATNEDLKLGHNYYFEKEPNKFADTVLKGHKSNDFSFLMMEDNEALRDEFNAAITDMEEDGTLDRLVSEQIDAVINGEDVESIEMPEIEGAETIKVAVTGALPPMDYVAADGTPAGFNTAVLAEISQRIGKNIEPVVVDSIGRLTALASGTVDAVFWARTSSLFYRLAQMEPEELEEREENRKAEMTEEEIEVFDQIDEVVDLMEFSKADMPEGTICTIPYFSDIIVPVMKK